MGRAAQLSGRGLPGCAARAGRPAPLGVQQPLVGRVHELGGVVPSTGNSATPTLPPTLSIPTLTSLTAW